MIPWANRFTILVFILGFFVFCSPLCAQPPSPSVPPRPLKVIAMSEAIQLALEHNQAMRAQRLNIDQSKANEITASLKPNLVYTTSNEDFPIFDPSQLTWDNVRTNQEFLQSISYTFERGGKRKKRILVAQDSTDIATKGVTDFERQLKFQVAQTFVNVLLAKSNLQFSSEDLKDFSEVVAINKSRLDAGDISEADYLKIALQKLQLEQDVSGAELALVQSKAALRQLLGYETVAEDFDVLGELGHKKYTFGSDELARQALLLRPDLQAAQSAVKLADDTITLAYGNRARDLTAEWEYKRNGPVNGVGFGFSFDLPIHDRNQGEIARSKVAARQAEQSQSATRVSVLTDVVNAYSSFKTNDHIVSLYESGYLEQARQSREISNYAYRKGATSLLDLLDAERSYRAIQLAYRQALSAFMLSAEQINLVVGKQVLQ
jgi:outer membrane protein, heavy metal efflux system